MRQAIRQIARATPAKLARCTRDSDLAFAARVQTQTACDRQADRLGAAANVVIQDISGLRRDVLRFDAIVGNAGVRADDVSRARATLWNHVALAQSRLDDAMTAHWLADIPTPVVAPAAPSLDFRTSVAHALSNARMSADAVSESRVRADAANLQELAAALLRLQDATEYLELSGARERANLRRQCEAMAGRLDQARAWLLDDERLADADLTDWSTVVSDRQAAARALDADARASSNAARDDANHAATAEAGLRQQLENEERQAVEAWKRAYRAAYGVEPPQFAIVEPSPPAPPAATAAPPAAALGPISSHAYDFFDTFDRERCGFGAYTYVLMGSQKQFWRADENQRYRHLLDAIQRRAAVAAAVMNAEPVNLFCIPIEKTGPHGEDRSDAQHCYWLERPRPADATAYGSFLGDQLKLNAQSGLFLSSPLRGHLQQPGPFLLTLPTRLTAASSSSPCLLADLSKALPQVVEDLVDSYMKSLVDDFPSRQQLWRPQGAQGVALSLIWMGNEARSLVHVVFPARSAS